MTTSLRRCVQCDGFYAAGTYRIHRTVHPRKKRVWVARTRNTDHLERRAAIVAAWETGRSCTDVGSEFGITRERVRQIVRLAGYDRARHILPPRVLTCQVCGDRYTGSFRVHARAALHAIGSPRKRGLAAKTRQMAEAYAEGGDAKEIASRFGVSPVTVYKAANECFGNLRYGQPGRVRPRTARTRIAVEMLRNGDPIWLVSESAGMNRAQVHRLRTRYIDDKAEVPA